MSGPARRTRLAILVIAGLLLFSVAGKWFVFRVFLGEEEGGRQRIEAPAASGASGADQSGS